MKREVNILMASVLAMAVEMDLPVMAGKYTRRERSLHWKETQSEEDKQEMLRKAEEKRQRKLASKAKR